MTDQVWWQSDLNCRQEVVHKHTYKYTYISTPIYLTKYRRRRKHNLLHLRWGEVIKLNTFDYQTTPTRQKSFWGGPFDWQLSLLSLANNVLALLAWHSKVGNFHDQILADETVAGRQIPASAQNTSPTTVRLQKCLSRLCHAEQVDILVKVTNRITLNNTIVNMHGEHQTRPEVDENTILPITIVRVNRRQTWWLITTVAVRSDAEPEMA